jgi:hypothetical protein
MLKYELARWNAPDDANELMIAGTPWVRLPRGWLEGLLDNLRFLESDNKRMFFALQYAEEQFRQLAAPERPDWFTGTVTPSQALPSPCPDPVRR